MKKIDPALHERLVILISKMGYEWVGYERVPRGRQMLFRIYIDSPSGVTVDDCAKVNHQVSAMLDVEDPFRERYVLEVSSPGIDRPLFEIEHYRRYIGKRVKIRLERAINGRKQYKGTVLRVEGDNIYLLEDGATLQVALPFSSIEKGNLIGDIRL